MAGLSITGQMKVSTLQEDFQKASRRSLAGGGTQKFVALFVPENMDELQVETGR